jgi:thiol-disulfide isomerase/thioredoxin
MKPPIFRDLDFEAAREEAKRAGKLLLVAGTASWSEPCHALDRRTWVDAAVVARLQRKWLGIQIDIVAQPTLAKQLRLRSMPTVIAFRDADEVDRLTGVGEHDEIVGWLEGIERGETSLERKRAETLTRPRDMWLRMEWAQKLVEANMLDEATEVYVWLWQHMVEHDPNMSGVRHSFFMLEFGDFLRAHAPARGTFSRLRDDCEPPTDCPPSFADVLADWFTLNHALDENWKGLKWFDKPRDRSRPSDNVQYVLEHDLVPLLIEQSRWRDIGLLFEKPLKHLAHAERQRVETLRLDSSRDEVPGLTDSLKAFMGDEVRKTAAMLVRALRAAGRHDDAKAVSQEALRIDPSEEMRAALDAAAKHDD